MWAPGSASLVFTGFGDRLLSEVKKLAPKDVKIKVRLQGAPWGMGVLGNLDWGEERANATSRHPLTPSSARLPPSCWAVPTAPS